MGKEKRKNRLDKGGASAGGEFVGFGAFSQPSTQGSDVSSSQLKWSPVYTGSDSQLSILFKKIGQKRDGSTKAKALLEVKAFIEDETNGKKDKVTALAHLLFAYHSKLTYDDSATVRAAALSTLNSARLQLPKALNTLLQENSELVGMIWCAKTDPASEVRAAARKWCQEYSSDDFDGLWSFVTRILGYGRPKTMHDDIFARRSGDEALSDLEREQLDERFERIVGTVLQGVDAWLKAFPETDSLKYETHIKDSVLWKQMTNSRNSFRLKAYQVLGTMCQHSKSVVYGKLGLETLPKTLPAVVAQEKEPSNIPHLFEVILLYMTSGDSSRLDKSRLFKAINKVLKKACFGASPSDWGPMMLPLLATVDDLKLSMGFISNLLAGRDDAIGLSDSLLITSYGVECSSYLLLRAEGGESMDTSDFDAILSLWLEMLKIYLSTSGVTSVSRHADVSLATILGKTLCRLDEASISNEASRIYERKDLFWKELLPAVLLDRTGSEVTVRFSSLLQKVGEVRKTPTNQSHLLPLLRKKFTDILSDHQSHSSALPGDQEYQLMQSCMEFSSATNIFGSGADNDIDLQNFLMNDLLRWVVIHASRDGSEGRRTRTKLAVRDFSLLRVCLESILSAHKQSTLWGTVLHELVLSKCDVGILAAGLRTMCQCSASTAGVDMTEVVKCEALENLSMQVVEGALQNAQGEGSTEREDFLRTCCGLHPAQSSPLLGKAVVSKFLVALGTVPEDQVPVSVLAVLVECAKKGKLLLRDDAIKLTMLTWKIGGDVWSRHGLALLTEAEDSLRTEFFEKAGEQLRDSLLSICCSHLPHTEIEASCDKWGERAVQWFRVMDTISGYEKFAITGLANAKIWREAASGNVTLSSVLSRCTTTLLLGVENREERLGLLFPGNQDEDRVGLFSDMLTSVSALANQAGSLRVVSVSSFVASFGGRDVFSDGLIVKCVDELVESVKASWETSCTDLTHKGLIGISHFLQELFVPFLSNDCDMNETHTDSAAIKTGDVVWYVPNPDQSAATEAKVVKIHKDDFPNLYFTISFETDGAVQEKQTVAERLRHSKSPRYYLEDGDMSQEERSLRLSIGSILMKKIIKPHFNSDIVQGSIAMEAGAVCVNILVSQCGLMGKAGLGSDRYYLFQKLASLQEQVVHSVASGDFGTASFGLRMLSLALGWGELSLRSLHNLEYLNFDPSPSLDSLVSVYDGGSSVGGLNKAALLWIETAFTSIQTNELKGRVLQTITLLVDHMSCDTMDNALLAMKAMRTICRSSSTESSDLERRAISKLIYAFATRWETPGDKNEWWSEPLEALVVDLQRSKKSTLYAACRENSSHLVGLLSIKAKRWLATRFLYMASKTCAPLRVDAFEDMLPTETRKRLKHWTKDMIQDDAEELEDDTLTVYEWIPSELMTEVESWIDDESYFDEAIEEKTTSRLLAWLLFLQYLESAAADDVRNRSAFSSYASKSGASFFVLSACVVSLNIEVDRKSQAKPICTVDDVLRGRELADVSSLSMASLFHTIEAFPTLARGWWEDDCPKSLKDAMSKFVQFKVAPETLRRELQRINEARNLGEMTVRGSTVSREVTATYLQDECILSLAIQVPPNFPLRSVDVDGRKTHGVPESRFKRWALQIRQILSNQDGTLLDALLLWKRNVEKEFEGVEPCPVCYSVLSVKTHDLPNLECKTCANRFHSSCLHKWFASSGKSQCVICQQPWSGTRVT